MPPPNPKLGSHAAVGSWVLTSSCVSSCSGRKAASRIAVWSALSRCHSLISKISKWVALFRPANDCNSLSWFSSTASARAITWRNDRLWLGTISQSSSPRQISFAALLFFFQTAWGALSSATDTSYQSHPSASFLPWENAPSNSKSIWPGKKISRESALQGQCLVWASP